MAVSTAPRGATEKSGQTTEIDFYFDPGCPWAWRTSLWIREVAKVRPVTIHWKFLRLESINTTRGGEVKQGHIQARDSFKLMALARREQGDEAIDRLYLALGQAKHDRKENLAERDVLLRAIAEAVWRRACWTGHWRMTAWRRSWTRKRPQSSSRRLRRADNRAAGPRSALRPGVNPPAGRNGPDVGPLRLLPAAPGLLRAEAGDPPLSVLYRVHTAGSRLFLRQSDRGVGGRSRRWLWRACGRHKSRTGVSFDVTGCTNGQRSDVTLTQGGSGTRRSADQLPGAAAPTQSANQRRERPPPSVTLTQEEWGTRPDAYAKNATRKRSSSVLSP